MKDDLISAVALARIDHAGLLTYLNATGWKRKFHEANIRSIWTMGEGKNLAQVAVPLNDELRQYHFDIARALVDIGLSERRSAMAVLGSVQTMAWDVFRIREIGDAFLHGSVPLEKGTQLFAEAAAMVRAAAYAAEKKRGVFLGDNRTERVEQFLQKSHFGQTEMGSYTVTLLTPIDPDFRDKNDQLVLSDGVGVPFERKVTETLMVALAATREALDVSTEQGQSTVRPFENAIRKGVSANLLDALAGVTTVADVSKTEITMGWSLTHTKPSEAPSIIQFESKEAPVLRAASRQLRLREPKESTIIKGEVVGLESENLEEESQIIVRYKEGSREQRVRVVLPSESYRKAIHAHEKGVPISCVGELTVQSGKSVLANPRQFIVLETPSLPFEESDV